MTMPSEFFQEIFDDVPLELQRGDTAEAILQKMESNILKNFLSHFRFPDSKVNVHPDPECRPLLSNQILAENIINSANSRYMDSLKYGNNIFAFYIDEEEADVVEKFLNGEATQYFLQELKPLVAELLERGCGTPEQIMEKYSEFLTTNRFPECKSSDDFWDSSALKLYGYHLVYHAELLKLENLASEHDNNKDMELTSPSKHVTPRA